MKNKYIFAIIYGVILILFTLYMILDTFVISTTYSKAQKPISDTSNMKTGEISTTLNTYEDNNIKINIKEYTENNTKIYVADIQINNPALLKTGLANDSYGKNITSKTSTIAKETNAILAINGDYYGVQESGYVLKNGTIYRSTASKNKEDLVIYEDGKFKIINESETDINTLLKNGAYNILSFGPALVREGTVLVDENQEVGKSMASNPRTAIGIIDDLHYVFVVSDGRTTESKGLSLYQLAVFMQHLGVETAYNLDGGGSSTMYFNGKIVNKPTTNGNKISERGVSDIVYIGY